MPRRRRISAAPETLGQRLARLRRARGLTQIELGRVVGLSDRMISYYEKKADRPPAQVLPEMARALGVSVDELLGVRPLAQDPPLVSVRLWKRFKLVEKLPPTERRMVFQLIDGFLARRGPDSRS